MQYLLHRGWLKERPPTREYRQFYLLFPDLLLMDSEREGKWRTPFAVSVNPIWRTAFAKLYWSHYQRVLKVPDQEARVYYLQEAASGNWSIRTLDRNIATLYYHRLLSSQDKAAAGKDRVESTKAREANSNDFIRNPAVLEFLNLPTSKAYTESQLEQALIDNLQNFLLELGKGFAFVARQKHIRTETQDFDLVFYNYILKCFVIIELKNNKLTHQDIGQLVSTSGCLTTWNEKKPTTPASAFCSVPKPTKPLRNIPY